MLEKKVKESLKKSGATKEKFKKALSDQEIEDISGGGVCACVYKPDIAKDIGKKASSNEKKTVEINFW